MGEGLSLEVLEEQLGHFLNGVRATSMGSSLQLVWAVLSWKSSLILAIMFLKAVVCIQIS